MTYVRKWNLKQVVGHVKKGELEEICKNETQCNPGTQGYMAGYQGALGRVVERLGEEEVEEYLALAKEWNERSAPPEVQRRFVRNRLRLYEFNLSSPVGVVRVVRVVRVGDTD